MSIPIVSGDQVTFMFPQLIFTAPPITQIHSAHHAQVLGKSLCTEGDEKKVLLQIPYQRIPFTVPGMGTLKIARLGADQMSQVVKLKAKKILLQGSGFTAEFQVSIPAQDPSSATPDPQPKQQGTGQFIPSSPWVMSQ